MGFALFIILNAVLFIRPAEIIPGLEWLPIYHIVIIACTIATLPRILAQLTSASLAFRPISVCVLGLMLAVPASLLFGKFDLNGAIDAGIEFSKNVVYYLLLVANLRNPNRLRSFIGWLCVLFVIVTLIAVLHYHNIIVVPGIKVTDDFRINSDTGEKISTLRLGATGIFGDPNDFSMLAVIGMALICFACFTNNWRGLKLASWSALPLLFYTLVLTASRGGLLAFLVSTCVLLQNRFGWKRAMPLVLVIVLVLPLVIGGRQSEIGSAAQRDTGQSRIQLWSEGLMLFRRAPVFGIGYGEFVENTGLVAHNSFIHAYSELGFFGGTLFISGFSYSIWALYRLRENGRFEIEDPFLYSLRPFILAVVAGYTASMMSLSRNYVVPTYMVLGLSASYLVLVKNENVPELALTPRLVKRLILCSLAFLTVMYVFVRVFANFG